MYHYKTALLHGILIGLCVNIYIYIDVLLIDTALCNSSVL